MTFCTKIFNETPAKEILDHFPFSQHQPSLITIPLQVTYTKTSPIPRWNFRKAIREDSREITNRLVIELPTPSPSNLNEAYKRFTSALKTVAKASMPRDFQKSYIPTWDDECVSLLNEHHTAAALFDHLNEKRECWIETVSNINFTHSSRRA